MQKLQQTDNHNPGKYCHACGALSVYLRMCPGCGIQVPHGHNFCIRCGNHLPAEPEDTQPEGVSKQLDDFVNSARSFLRPASASVQDLLGMHQTTPPRAVETAIVVALTLIALLIRIWNLSDVPAGLHGDELLFAEHAQAVIDGARLDSSVWARAILYVGWMSILIQMADADIGVIRLTSATFGAAIAPMSYLLVRSLFPFRVALITASMTTASLWYLIASRIAFPMVMSIFALMLAMYLAVLAIRHRRWWLAALAGLALGMGLYTYKVFLAYFMGFWAVALMAALLHPNIRRQKYIWIILAVSALVSMRLLTEYATDFDFIIVQNLRDEYGREEAIGLSGITQAPEIILKTLLLVNNPITGGSIDASPQIPIVPLMTAVFFWVGLAIAALSIRQGRYQALVAAWAIGFIPVLVVPGSEGRRYLFGIFCVLAISSIGLSATVSLIIETLRTELSTRLSDGTLRRTAIATSAAVIIIFLTLFCATSASDFRSWASSEDLRWYFYHDSIKAFKFIESLDDRYEVRYFSNRIQMNGREQRYFSPGITGLNASPHVGGDGTLLSAGPVTRDTAFILLDDYLHLAMKIENTWPDSRRFSESTDNGDLVYIAYLIRRPDNIP